MGKTDVGPTAVADCGPMKMPMEARHRADEFCQLGRLLSVYLNFIGLLSRLLLLH